MSKLNPLPKLPDLTVVQFTYEELLQFLVAVVDAKLFEAVPSENLESIDVEHPDDGGVGHVRLCGGGVNGCVHLTHNPGEQSVVQRLRRVQKI